MDFANLDLKTASERGSWVHLTHDGEPLFLDDTVKNPKKPCRVLVRGIGAEGVAEAYRKVERIQRVKGMRIERASDTQLDGVLADNQSELKAAFNELMVAAVADLENIQWDGKVLTLSDENVLKLCGVGTIFFAQVNKVIAESHRLFTNASTAS